MSWFVHNCLQYQRMVQKVYALSSSLFLFWDTFFAFFAKTVLWDFKGEICVCTQAKNIVNLSCSFTNCTLLTAVVF